MPTRDPRIDEYIKNAADFAKPILKHIRKLVHDACPNVEETMKWSFPHFDYKGMMCSMAAFNEHCSFGFWKGELILGKRQAAANREEGGMGAFGRITALSDLPKDDVLLGYIKEAVRLNDAGIKLPPKPKEKKELIVPDYILAALKKNPKARTAFENFSYSHKKEYVEWISEAKGEDTRQKRIETAIEWMAEREAEALEISEVLKTEESPTAKGPAGYALFNARFDSGAGIHRCSCAQ